MTHFGSGIWSYNRRSTGAIFLVTVPATIIRSDCRGEARNTSAPKRAMSNRDAEDGIISMAQQARPNPIGQIEDSRAQFSTRSMLVVMKLSSKRWSMSPMVLASPRLGPRADVLAPEVVRVGPDERRPSGWRLVQREDGFDGAGRDAGPAVDALVGMNIEHLRLDELWLVFPGMDTIDWTDVDAGCVLRADARFANDVGHVLQLLTLQ